MQPGQAEVIGRIQPLPEPPSFTWKAFATLVLYCVFWIPGLCANLMFLAEARSVHRRTGHEPAGIGCLFAMLVANLAWIAVIVFFWSVIVASMGLSRMK